MYQDTVTIGPYSIASKEFGVGTTDDKAFDGKSFVGIMGGWSANDQSRPLIG